ncbi:MAG: hypothetical protein ACKO96_32390, partial [Flammeovirgaceae bacterium]
MEKGLIRHWRQTGLALDHFSTSADNSTGRLAQKAVALKYQFNATEEKAMFKYLKDLRDNQQELQRLGVDPEELEQFIRRAERVGLTGGVQIGVNFQANELFGYLDSLAPKSGNDFLSWMTRF